MRLENFGLRGGQRKTLIILGAGASRGASFVSRRTDVLPPLDLDFFQQLARLNDCAASARLIEFVRTEYPNELRLSMEQFFSEADYTNRFHSELSIDKGPRVKKYDQALSDFYVAIARVLSESAGGSCKYHSRIVELLTAEDSILSFNYDCIMDRALREKGSNRWDPERGGYGVTVTGATDRWRSPAKGKSPQGTIRLLKMHGSLNWEIINDVLSLRDSDTASTAEGSIIPPSWFKNLTSEPYATIWRNARRAVRSARIIAVVGYSVPVTDLFSQSLLKVEAGSKEKREKLDALVLVNPDRDARRRFLDIVRNGLESSTRVLEYESMDVLHERLS